MTAIRSRANKIIEDIGIFTFQKFEDAFYMRHERCIMISFSFYDEYIESLKNEDRVKTADNYATAMRSFKGFRNKIGFYDITSDFLKKYHKWMIDQGNAETTIGIYTRSLRAIYNYGISKGVIKKDEN
jgi:site-specific recombinase XerD